MSDKRVAVYIRVSTNEQASEGYSIPEQKVRCEKYCDAMGYTVARIYTDPGYSGANIDRPAMQQLISDIKSDLFDIVLVYKLDRLSRSQKDTLYLIEDVFLKNNVSFISMSENFDTASPFGRAMIGILSVFAQLEREQIKERMEMGRIGAAKMGRWRGGSGVPLGYDYTAGDGGMLKINPYEAEQIVELFQLWIDGVSSHQICNRFQAKGYTNKYGEWNNPGCIPSIVSNPVYIGMQKYAGQVFPGLHKPIITEETFQAAERELARRRANLTESQRTGWRGKHLLTGILFCGECGARYFVIQCNRKDKDGKPAIYRYYKCYTRDGNRKMRRAEKCSNKLWRLEYLNALVLSEIRKLAYDSSTLIDKMGINHKPPKPNKAITDRIKSIDKQISSLIDLYQLEDIPLDEVGMRISKLRTEKEKLTESIQTSISDNPSLPISEAKKILKSAIGILDTGSDEEKRSLVAKLIRKVTVNQDEIEITWAFT